MAGGDRRCCLAPDARGREGRAAFGPAIAARRHRARHSGDDGRRYQIVARPPAQYATRCDRPRTGNDCVRPVMATALDRDIRKILGNAVREARGIAEDGARKALEEIGLEDAKRPERLSPKQTDLRNKLRAHARALGDIMAPDGSIKANRLVREIAYEHWHRALFARFLAASDLLVDPDNKVAVRLGE